MPITINSTTDSDEVVQAALGGEVTTEETVEEKPAPEEEIQEGESDDNSEGQEEVQEAAQEKPKKNGFKKRIDKLTSKLTAKEQEAEYWRDLALKAQKPAEQSAEKKPAVTSDKKPKADDFESHDEFVEALTDWKLEQKLSDREAAQKEKTQKSEFEQRIQKFNERTAAFAEEHDDFEDVVNSVKAPLPALVQEAILDSELAPQLLYELAQNEDERKRICEMPSAKAVMELGKIEARLSGTKPVETKTTKAPPPVTPVRTRTSGQHKSIYDEDLSQREYERLREEQLRNKGA